MDYVPGLILHCTSPSPSPPPNPHPLCLSPREPRVEMLSLCFCCMCVSPTRWEHLIHQGNPASQGQRGWLAIALPTLPACLPTEVLALSSLILKLICVSICFMIKTFSFHPPCNLKMYCTSCGCCRLDRNLIKRLMTRLLSQVRCGAMTSGQKGVSVGTLDTTGNAFFRRLLGVHQA